jgi:poly-gamma-glutamate capsule biosynthesis protein CapA/YwtB (metallophosphatase superfamily)
VFAGDFSFGENYLAEEEAKGGENVLETRGYDYCVEKLEALMRDADIVVANLETAVTDLPESPFVGKKYYIHWTDPVLAPAALVRHNVRAVTLANNHGFDYGMDGLRQTLSSLDSAGIAWFGAGMSEAEAARPFAHDLEVAGKRLRVVVAGGFEYAPHYDRTYRFFARADTGGVNNWTVEGAAAQVRAIRERDPGAFIVAFPHWGYNYRWKNHRQLATGRAVIDAGADLVIGHGAHMLQEIDRYNGRWIVYNLGNFVFNSPSEYDYYHIHPYSFAAVLDVSNVAGELAMRLRLYPITSDNAVTHYQSGPVTETEFDTVEELLLSRGPVPRVLREGMTRGRDDFGRFFELDVTLPPDAE